MPNKAFILVAAMAIVMVISAHMIGLWADSAASSSIADSEAANSVDIDTSRVSEPDNRYLFGVSLGLLAIALVYGFIAAALMLLARTKNTAIPEAAVGIGLLAAVAFVLSYLLDGVFI